MKMRSLFAVAALATCTAGVAMAADLPMRSPPPAPFVPPPLFTWSGFYAGVNAGASFDTGGGNATTTGFTPALGFLNAGTVGPFKAPKGDAGFIGGGQIGYNIQNGMFVYGLEADIDYFGGSGKTNSYADSNIYGPGGTFGLTRRSGDGYLGTVRGRLGIAAFDRTLLYVTGGLAYGDYGNSFRGRFTDTAGNFGAAGVNHIDLTSGSSDIRLGYALGAGVEYAITPNMSVKAEYLYTDLGSKTYHLTDSALTPATYINVKDDGTSQLARLGLNYKF